jgi:predicted PurR-regulated permease PerM
VAFLYDPALAAWTALAALGVQQFENNVIIPWAMSRGVHLHPLVTLFAVILFGSLFSALGVLLSLPLVILVWTVVQVLWVERTIGSAGERIRPVVQE